MTVNEFLKLTTFHWTANNEKLRLFSFIELHLRVLQGILTPTNFHWRVTMKSCSYLISLITENSDPPPFLQKKRNRMINVKLKVSLLID